MSDTRLEVSLDGETPPGWRDTFARTAALLGSGDWEEVKLKKRAVHVSGVTPGSEDKLRHHLESIVQEANAAHAPDADGDDSSGAERHEAHEGEDSAAEARPSPDSEMTERFRSFAQSPPST